MGARTFFSDPPTNGNTTFAERLEWLCAGRTIGAWAKRIGMRGASIDALRGPEGRPPGQEFLTRIMRIENASISWLLGGNTPPFLVARTASDGETGHLLAAHLGDEAWQLEVAHDADERTALVLHQPAAIVTDKGEDIPYRAVQVIAGPCGARTADHLPDGCSVHYLTAHAMDALYAGRVGTWLLFGGEDQPPLLDANAHYPAPSPRPSLRIAESHGTPPERLAAAWPDLPKQDRHALDVVITAVLTRPK